MTVGTVSRIPEVSQAVRVRNRLVTVRAVEPYDSRTGSGRSHIVEVEYLDDWRHPESEQLLWEVEATGTVLGTTSLPGVDANRPDSPRALLAFVNAHRWTRLNRPARGEAAEAAPGPPLPEWCLPQAHHDNGRSCDGAGLAPRGVQVAVYLDGMSRGLHGDPKTAQRDQLIRGMLELDGYTVVVVQSRDLDDPQAVRLHLKDIAQAMGRNDLAQAVESAPLQS